MVFPVVGDYAVTNYEYSSESTFDINSPSSSSGDGLLLFVSQRNVGISDWGGYTKLFDRGNYAGLAVGYRDADGSEGSTFQIALNSADSLGAIVLRLDQGTYTPFADTPPEFSARNMSGNLPNPGELIPTWGSATTLWFTAITTMAGEDDFVLIQQRPDDFTNITEVTTHYSSSSRGPFMLSVEQRPFETNALDPTRYAVSGNDYESTLSTLAIRPGSGVVPPSHDYAGFGSVII
jgi:hypothetical protein